MKKEVLHIKANDSNLRNEMHFDVQKNTRMNIFKDKTKYTRKRKHKKSFEEE